MTVRIEIVPSGIDVARFAQPVAATTLCASAGSAPGDRLILCVGRLAKEKNVELLLQRSR